MEIFESSPKTKKITKYDLQKLSETGWILLTGIDSEKQSQEVLSVIGNLLPQYDGAMQNTIASQPGFEDHLYSKSQNSIGPHTEATAMSVPPKYLALYCHNQARCGGGLTYLCDTKDLKDNWTDEQRKLAREFALEFKNTTVSPKEQSQNIHPIYEDIGKDDYIFRFSHNLFFHGDINAKHVNSDQRPLIQTLPKPLAELINDCLCYFEKYSLGVLLPKNSLLIWDNFRLVHFRSSYKDSQRKLTRYWVDRSAA